MEVSVRDSTGSGNIRGGPGYNRSGIGGGGSIIKKCNWLARNSGGDGSVRLYMEE